MPAASESTTHLSLPSDTEILLTRRLMAPPPLVWRAWTDPQRLARWWGPVGFTTTTKSMDVRPGGSWRFTMHGPDGRDYENLINYITVDEPRTLIYKHGGGQDTEPVNFKVTATFEPSGSKGGNDETLVTLRMVFPSKNARDFVIREYNAAEGGKQTLARLEEFISKEQTTPDAEAPFVIQRVFRAPRDLVWKAWTQQELLARWFGPKGMSMPKCALDLRVGGIFHYCLQSPQGQNLWGCWVFREISPPARLVYVASFSDEHGKQVRAFFNDKWPLEVLSTITFDEHAGKDRGTVVTIRAEAINATDEERALFQGMHSSMQHGWDGTFDQLAEFLAGSR